MNFYREKINNLPAIFRVPPEFQDRDVEVIILPLDEIDNNDARSVTELDENGYPIGFFDETAGSIPDFPEREPQPPLEIRELID